ncbi:hypothetical protein BJV74DRAFT_573281 [Russula compacta]|nr:hypothetical protein BJV74DRAFT_573281 [Russula compacta]
MSPLYQILLVAAHAASLALITFPQVQPSPALAKPIARPLSSRTMTVHHVRERSARVLKSKKSKAKAVVPHDSHPSPVNVTYYPNAYSASSGSHISAGTYNPSGMHDIDILNDYYSNACNNAQTLKAYSSQASASRQKGTPYFEQKCASTLTDFHTNSQGFTTTLRRIDAYNGRAHYNEYPIETLLKKFIDLHKDFLRDVTELIKCYPFLGPLLGPIVYDIKCILDGILDLTDDIIAASLKLLIGEYGMVACKSGVSVGDICV